MKTIYKVVNLDRTESKFIIEDRDKPDLQSGEILVEVKAAATYDSNTQAFHCLLARLQRLQVPGGLTVAGVVSDVGPNVSRFSVGDRVTGVLSVSSAESALSDYCLVEEGDVVPLPETVEYTDVVGCLGDGVKAYTALSYLGHVTAGEAVFVYDGATSWGRIVVQLAKMWGAKVITSVSSLEERSILEHLPSSPDLIFERNTKLNTMVSHLLEETGNLGVDVVIDNGVRLFDQIEDCTFVEEDYRSLLPTRHDIISMLSVGGRWVTAHSGLQLDPPDSELLHLRGASVGFLCPYVWNLCPMRRGRLLHILHDLIKRLDKKEFVSKSPTVVSFTSLLDSIDDGNVSLEPGTVITM